MTSILDKRFQRLRNLYALILLTVAALSVLMASSKLLSIALNLALPGSGFLIVDGHLAHLGFAMSFVSFGLACVLWFGTGNVIAPIAVWILSAVASFIMTPEMLIEPAYYAFIAAPFVLWGVWIFVSAIPLSKKNEAAKWVEEGAIIAPPSLEQIQFLLDRALQPLDQFQGFEKIDQFQTSALRYQVNVMGYALSLFQKHDERKVKDLARAQFYLIKKQTQPQIWRYWRLENLWGNLRISADPIAKDNIMYSGFTATQIECFHNANKRYCFDRENSFVLQDGHHVFEYDQPKIIRALTEQYKTAKFGLLPCEPNWIYPLCNLISACSIVSFDHRNGTAHWDEIKESFRNALITEFTDKSGAFVPFCSAYTGLKAPQIGGVVVEAFAICFLNSVFPDLAREHWARVREKLMDESVLKHIPPVDVGNYQFTRASSLVVVAMAAREMGDEAIAARMLDLYEQKFPLIEKDGVAYREGVSIWAHSVEIMARSNRQSGLRDLLLNEEKLA